MKKLHIITIVMVALFSLQSCHGLRTPVRTSRVTITVGGKTSVSTTGKAGPARSLLSTALPSNVAEIKVIVSAPDMTTMTETIPVAGLPNVTITIEVPNGLHRYFLVEGLDAGENVLYAGEATADLSGAPLSLAISLNHLTPPAILSTSPASNASNVAINAPVSATFNWPMDNTTIIASTFFVQDSLGTPVSGSILATGATATFTPSANLAYGTTYSATITTGVKDLTGLSLASDYTWTFTISPDSVPPTFNGLALVTSPTPTTQQLSWSAASDNGTPPSGIVYLIYQATSAGGENFVTPTYATAPGATSYLVTVPTPGVYYYVVRAQDAAGNNDGNTVELSGYYAGTYVNVATGSDVTGNGSPTAPYQTITYAISQATTTVLVAPGVYSSGTSTIGPSIHETLPLTLKTGMSLICYGINFTSVIDDSLALATTAIIMNDPKGLGGSLIDGCRVNVGTSYPAIDDSSQTMTINDNLVSGISSTSLLNPPTTGILLSAASTVLNSTIEGFPGPDGGGSGILVSAAAIITKNTFTNNYDGINVSAGSPLISANTITGNMNGVNVVDGSPTINNNTITYNSSNGVYSNSTTTTYSPVVSNNVISDNGSGIYTQGGSWNVSNNTISDNIGSGISFYDSLGNNIGGSVTGNTISANDTGISIYGGSTDTFPSIYNNIISCNVTVDLTSNALMPVSATPNSWDHDSTTTPPGPTVGVASCTGGVDICGNVTYSPFNSAVSGGCP